ncbi:MAG TPA: hypothetical protein VNW71_19465 [Thermoanaerobaculia bacterium]|nr:hypothetical protein [Thermoanaerobaculia bacterium]
MAVLTYSPSHVDPALLERLTIGASRHHLLGTLVEAVYSEVGRDAHQHHLLIGPRGSGKTHILTLTAHRLRTDPELGPRTLPLTLAEEVVASHPADLMRRVLAKLSETLDGMDAAGAPAARRGTGAALAALRSEPDDDRALEIAMGALEEASEALGRLLVPVVENLNLLLYSGPGLSRRSETPGQWALRRALLEARGVLLLAASPTLFGEVCDPQAPFYDFFRMHRLEELHPDEMLDLIRARLAVELESDGLEASHRARLQTLSDSFEERTPKLRGLLTLTGGLPRFAHLLFDLLAETDVPRIVDLLARFLDKQTPYFQPYLDPRMHPEAELEVLDRLASAEGPLTRREIAAGLRAGSMNAISVYLKRLQGKGLVRQLGTSRKDIRYDLTEPLFRVWRRFRLGRNEREQVVLIAQFVAAMFEPAQLQAEWSQLEGVESAGFRRRVLEIALERQGWRVPLLPGSERAIADADLQDAFKEIARGFTRKSVPRIYELSSRAVERLKNQENPRLLATALILVAQSALLLGRKEEAFALSEQAEPFADKLGNLDRGLISLSRSNILLSSGNKQAALRAAKHAEGLFKKAAFGSGQAGATLARAHALLSLGEQQNALQSFRDAEKLYRESQDETGQAGALLCYGEVLLQLDSDQEALQAFEKAETLLQQSGDDRERARAIQSRADILLRLHNSQDALKAFKEAEILFQRAGEELGVGGCHLGYGRIAASEGRYEESLDHLLSAYQLARKLGERAHTNVVLSALWTQLLHASAVLEHSRLSQLLRKAEPLLNQVEEDESTRSSLVQFTLGALFVMGHKRFVDMLPILEAGLPASQSNLLRPIRLVAEIQAGQRSANLPEEPDEMRRAVLQVQEQVEELRRAMKVSSKAPAKKRSSTGRKPRNKKLRHT